MHFAINIRTVPAWHHTAKRLVDISISSAAMVVLSPLLLFTAIRVAFSSAGPVLYSQERVGYLGKKFRIWKFRSMFTDAEAGGPQLSTHNDKRTTSWGKTMRKWKLDELPQLWNVLLGDMSLVGPRPEREYFIRQLEQQRQPFHHLLQVKPGITSLGMLKYGYAANIGQMAERMKFDLIYLEKKSLALDMKILLGTVKMVILSGTK